MLELDAAGQQINRQHIKAQRNRLSITLGNLAEVGRGHLAEQALFVGVDLRFGRSAVARGAGFDLKEDQRVAIPGNEIEVAGEAFGAPAAWACPPCEVRRQ